MYIAMAGMRGCMPNACEEFDTLKGAVDFMADLHELTRSQKAKLRRERWLDSSFDGFEGNEYIEITESEG